MIVNALQPLYIAEVLYKLEDGEKMISLWSSKEPAQQINPWPKEYAHFFMRFSRENTTSRHRFGQTRIHMQAAHEIVAELIRHARACNARTDY